MASTAPTDPPPAFPTRPPQFGLRSLMLIVAACAIGLALTIALPCRAAGLTWPPITEPPTSQHVRGKWVWVELFTEDVNAAMRFYGEAFGWSFQAFPAALIGMPGLEPLQPGASLRWAVGDQWVRPEVLASIEKGAVQWVGPPEHWSRDGLPGVSGRLEIADGRTLRVCAYPLSENKWRID